MKYKALKAVMDSTLREGVPGFDAVLLRNGKCEFSHRAGYSDPEQGIAMNGTERFNVYSCTKMLTCTALLQLWEQGKVALDDPLWKYLPEYKNMTVRTETGIVPAQRDITIHHVLTMTAGFSYDFFSPSLEALKEKTQHLCTTRQVAEAIAREPLLFQPGEKWQYSMGHDVLAAVIEVISGQTFAQYIKTHIFDPLGMQDSTIGATDAELETVSPLYIYNRQTKELTSLGKTDYARLNVGKCFQSGGAGCISTLADFVKFLEALRVGDVILKRTTIDMMFSDQLTPEQKKTYWWQHRCSYGYGVHCPTAGDRENGFAAWGGAAGAEPLIHREKGVTFFFFRHVLGADNDGINDALREAVRELL